MNNVLITISVNFKTSLGYHFIIYFLYGTDFIYYLIFQEFSYGPFRLVRIPSLEDHSIFPKLPKVNETRNGLVATLNFVRDAAEDMLTKRALVYTMEPSTGARSLSSGPIVVDEDEFSKMKLQKKGNIV